MPTGQMTRPRSPSWWDNSAMPFLSGIHGVMQDRLRQVSVEPFLPYAEAAASAGLLGTGDKGARQGLLDGTALATTAVPGYGDALGMLADAHRMAMFPEERTAGNAALAAAGLLPFVPALGTVKASRAFNVDDPADYAQVAESLGGNPTQWEVWHEAARHNATLPTQGGGLDLPPDNTYVDRRNSMMSVDPSLYHGGSGLQDVTTLHPSGVSTSSDAAKQAVFMGDNPAVANEFAILASQKNPSPAVMPVVMLDNKTHTVPSSSFGFDSLRSQNAQGTLAANLSVMRDDYGLESLRILESDDAVNAGHQYTEVAALNPDRIRGRFAAFDPFRRDVNHILASGAGVGLGAGLLAPYFIGGQESD